jgi:hypothetical protein
MRRVRGSGDDQFEESRVYGDAFVEPPCVRIACYTLSALHPICDGPRPERATWESTPAQRAVIDSSSAGPLPLAVHDRQQQFVVRGWAVPSGLPGRHQQHCRDMGYSTLRQPSRRSVDTRPGGPSLQQTGFGLPAHPGCCCPRSRCRELRVYERATVLGKYEPTAGDTTHGSPVGSLLTWGQEAPNDSRRDHDAPVGWVANLR